MPGLDEATFRDAVESADAGCPISTLIRGSAAVASSPRWRRSAPFGRWSLRRAPSGSVRRRSALVSDTATEWCQARCQSGARHVPGTEGCPKRAAVRLVRGVTLSPWPSSKSSSTSWSASYREAQERMSDPAVYGDRREAAEAGRRLKDLEAPYKLAEEWRAVRADLTDARGDGDLRELVPELETRLDELEEELKLALVESDPADRKDVIVEIRSGVGGDEAALWADDVFRMLTRYAERARLQVGDDLREPERGRRDEGDRVRGQGRRRLLGVQVGGRHAPRPARPADRVAGPHPHLHRDRRRHAGGRGGRGADRPVRPQDRRLPLERPRRPERQHDRLGRPHHARSDRDRRRRCRTSARSSRTASGRCASCARGSTSSSASASRPS